MNFDIDQKLIKKSLQVAGIMIKKAVVGETIIVGWSMVASQRLIVWWNYFYSINSWSPLSLPCLADYLQFTKQYLLSKLSQVKYVPSSTLH